ncbi:uncharacterized protein B0I36DRAFT_323020 [Microdochium trichocladiopsis]|uniref:Uncharacterized protein n=1 Tax=Microdochium trichocladiopsis TaxID=1682393 RepID=A0A9P8Y4G7_9PEZI|nr:uncharacterized protein B0I36DRAFT_323020 [Microdochium trichocladiopsis]KAH7031012.1 hypothetical protein B0I36DRAFT_323020 [Microdochium trichocladiopsis]
MCNYIQTQYHCGHFRFPVQRWCHDYETTGKRNCQPDVTCAEWRGDEVCPDCRPVPLTTWEWMIKRPRKNSFVIERDQIHDRSPFRHVRGSSDSVEHDGWTFIRLFFLLWSD